METHDHDHEHVVPIMIAAALLGVGLAALIADNVPVSSIFLGSIRGPAPTPKQRTYEVGQTANQGSYLLEITKVQIDPQGSPPFLPGTGYEYYDLTLKIKNVSRTVLQVAPVVQMYLRDKMGTNYELAPAPLLNPFEAGPLQVGEERSGEVSFDVPKSASGMSFVFGTGRPELPLTVVQLGR